MTAAVLHELRRTRRRRRVQELEWFEVLYQVYLVAIIGGGLVLWLSTYVTDSRLDPAGVAHFQADAPAWIGLAAAIVVAIGLRSGSHGGPLAVEHAEVFHVLLAPIRLRTALARPAYQRIRSVTFAGVLAGAIAGELAGRRLPGSVAEWALSGAAAGGTIALLAVGGALLVHTTRQPPWAITVLSGVLIVAQALAIAGTIPAGPFDSIGSLALWPLHVEPLDLVAPVVAIGVTVLGVLLLDRISVEATERRSALVAQLRFAVTMQDLRTVTLLRRQLSQETPRRHAWVRIGPGKGPVWRRSWRSLARFPGKRIGRMVLLAAVAGGFELAAYRGTTPAVLLAGAATFLLGLDALEPYSQELDHPEYTESYPVNALRLQQRLLIVPGIVLALLSLVGVTAAWALDRRASTFFVGLIICVPIALAGGVAAAFNTAGGAPDPVARVEEQVFLPPEVAGIKYVFKAVAPYAVAVFGCLPAVLVRTRAGSHFDPVTVAIRSAVFVSVVVALLVWWLERRQVLRRWWNRTVEEGRSAMKTR